MYHIEESMTQGVALSFGPYATQFTFVFFFPWGWLLWLKSGLGLFLRSYLRWRIFSIHLQTTRHQQHYSISFWSFRSFTETIKHGI